MRRRTFLQLAAASLAAGCDASRVVAWEHGALALAVTDEHVYWTSGVDHSGLIRVEHGGGEPQVLYDGMPWAVSLAPGPDAMFVGSGRGVERAPYVGLRGEVVVAQDGGAFRVVVDRDELFWLSRSRGAVRRADLSGKNVRALADGPPWAGDLAVAEDAVFWTAGEPGRLLRVGRGGGEAESLVTAPGLGPLAVAGSFLYFAHATGVSRLPLAGGAGSAEPVVEGRRSPSGLVAFGEGVAWNEEGQIVVWSEAGMRSVDAGRVLAMAASARTLWWMDGEGQALRRHGA